MTEIPIATPQHNGVALGMSNKRGLSPHLIRRKLIPVRMTSNARKIEVQVTSVVSPQLQRAAVR